MLAIIAVIGIALMSASCERRPLNERGSNNLLLRLKIELRVKNSGELPDPEVMRVIFFNPETGKRYTEDYVPAEGGYISVAPGNYNMIIYNFDTESTLVHGDNSTGTIEAYTNEISSALKSNALRAITKSLEKLEKEIEQNTATKGDAQTLAEEIDWANAMKDLQSRPIVYEPDHLFVARENVTIYNRTGEQVIEGYAESVVETYILAVRIKNKKYMASANALLTGQIRSNFIAYPKEEGKTDTNVTLYFNMNSDLTDFPEEKRAEIQQLQAEDKDLIWCTFNTFGKNPHVDTRLWLTILVTNTDGQTEEWHTDITDYFEDNEDQYIYIEEPFVDVPEPTPGGGGKGGFQPGVEDWEEEHHDILI